MESVTEPPLESEPVAVTVVSQLPVAVPLTLTLRVDVPDVPERSVSVEVLRDEVYPEQVLAWERDRATDKSVVPSFSTVMV